MANLKKTMLKGRSTIKVTLDGPTLDGYVFDVRSKVERVILDMSDGMRITLDEVPDLDEGEHAITFQIAETVRDTDWLYEFDIDGKANRATVSVVPDSDVMRSRIAELERKIERLERHNETLLDMLRDHRP